MVDMGKAAINSMNYFFLMSVFKEDYPQSVKEEISGWLEYVTKGIDRCNAEDADLTEALFDYAFQEINEGEYIQDVSFVPLYIEQYCKEETDLDERQIITLCNFYSEVCDCVLEREGKSDER